MGGSHEKKEGHCLVMELELIFLGGGTTWGAHHPRKTNGWKPKMVPVLVVSQLGALPKSLSKIGAFFY